MPILCPISGAGHDWGLLQSYERFISRGACDCGAVRFFPNDVGSDCAERADLLNKKHGKEGTVLSRDAALKMAVCKPENIIKKEVIETMAEKSFTEMSKQEKSHYIKQHLTEIVADIRSLKKQDVLGKWKLSPSTYHKIMKTHAPEVIQKRGASAKKDATIEADDKPDSEDKKTAVELLAEANIRIAYLTGFQACARELMGSKEK